ncbi:MAG: hypothetical protein ACJ8EJ_20065 [Xanthobacteraceae bacterium]
MATKSKKDDAQAQFEKLQRAEDGKKAMSEYEAEGAAVRAKTERLRALRLARDAAEAAAGPKKKIPAKKKTVKAAKGRPATLSSFLKDQDGGGRRS